MKKNRLVVRIPGVARRGSVDTKKLHRCNRRRRNGKNDADIRKDLWQTSI